MKKQYTNPKLTTLSVTPMGIMMSSGSDAPQRSISSNIPLQFHDATRPLDGAL